MHLEHKQGMHFHQITSNQTVVLQMFKHVHLYRHLDMVSISFLSHNLT